MRRCSVATYYTNEEKQQIKSLREQGLTHQEIFENYFPDRSKDSILSVCKRNRFIMQPHEKFTDEEREIVRLAAKNCVPFAKITEQLPNKSVQQIVSFAMRNGFNNKNTQGGRKYTCNKTFWDIPNEINSYWAGFAAADGHVHSEGKTENTYCFILLLQRRDKEHVNLLAKTVSYNGPVKDGSAYLKKYDKHYPNTMLRIHQKEWRAGLEKNFSIFPRKTWNLPVPNLSGHLLDCYLAGFMDGDGSYVICKNMDKIILSATGATTDILQELNKMSNRFDLQKDRVRNLKTVGNHFQYAVAGDTAVRMSHYLMSLPCPHLRRKFDRVRDFLISHPKYELSLPTYDQHMASLSVTI